MPIPLSVAICTHNPNLKYLGRALNALKSQTAAFELWELVVVDNASDEPIENLIDLSWHPRARVVSESILGLAAARLKSVVSTTGDLIVFVDDDNVLANDYLEQALVLSERWPMLGVWGGQIYGEFEIDPPDWAKEYLGYLAVGEVPRDTWSNIVYENSTTPWGAGMCVRRKVAEAYLSLAAADPRRQSLGRKGQPTMSNMNDGELTTAVRLGQYRADLPHLGGCEDADIAYLACDMGLGTGRFVNLGLTHIIPAKRLEEDYIVRIVRETAFATTLLRHVRGGAVEHVGGRSHKYFQKYLRFRLGRRSRRFFDAVAEGRCAAHDLISSNFAGTVSESAWTLPPQAEANSHD